MQRVRQPFFRESRGVWYVQLDGKQLNLGPDKEAAWARYYELMAMRSKKTELPASSIPYVVAILDRYLDWLEKRVQEGTKAVRTFAWYQRYIQSFTSSITATLTIDQLLPDHVYQWVDGQPGWKTGKRGAMTAVQHALRWAARAGLLKTIGGTSPLANLEKPAAGWREKLVSEAEYREVLAAVDDQEFRDVLELSWETWCRPFELFTVEAAFVDLTGGQWVFPVRLSKGKKIQRVVYLSERALEITRRLLLKRPTGALLLNTEGRQWCVSSVKCRFQLICREIGRRRLRQSGLLPAKIPRLKAPQRKDPVLRAEHMAKVLERRRHVNELARLHGIRLNIYAFRHSMVTEALVNGIDAVTVSVLAGHRDTTMVSRFYAHLTQRHEHMRAAANKARPSSASA